MLISRSSYRIAKRRAFTLVELLVVITIIGILIGMLLPAVNAARESGRNTQCKNNLMQLGRACLAHEEAQGIFPTGGWGWSWVGDPDHGYGTQQPGGWIYNILPHLEMNSLHDQQFVVSGSTISGKSVFGTGNAYSSASGTKQTATLQMVQTPLPMMMCPTRRRDAVFGNPNPTSINNAGNVPVSSSNKLARTDYAVNVGDQVADEFNTGPGAGADDLDANGSITTTGTTAQYNYWSQHVNNPVPPTWKGVMAARQSSNFTTYTGISFELSSIRKDDVTDGLSQTILAGEKYLDPKQYSTGTDAYDNENAYVGFDNDIGRTTSQAPMQDRSGMDDGGFAFGSAHATAANFVLCDGATISINYSVDPHTFKLLGNRSDGSAIDMSKLGIGGG